LRDPGDCHKTLGRRFNSMQARQTQGHAHRLLDGGEV
jgi:hypothetical protein